MNKGAILHIPLSEYAFATDEHTLIVRLRAQKGELTSCKVFYGDRVDPEKQIRVTVLEMERVASDDLFDYFEIQICDNYTRVCYYFFLEAGEEKLYYYERGFSASVTDNRTEYFQFPYLRREDIITVPKWAEDIVMYHIFPDSFASEKGVLTKVATKHDLGDAGESVSHLGGTLKGVTENLDYLCELGVNCIYLNPIFSANSYHKYDTVDYFTIDSCLGTEEDFKMLVDTCHTKGIRIILDGVFNHCGANFFAFRDVLAKGSASKYYDWFYHMPEPIVYAEPPSYEAFAYVKEMPKLNTGCKAVEDYFIQVGVYWIEKFGIDGWRLDVANEINHNFWRRFRDAMKAVKPDIFLIGEIWEDAGKWLMGDQFDSTMNYRFSYLCRDFFAKRSMSVSEFDGQMQRMIMRYPSQTSLVQMNFLDSHDVPRFLTECEGDRRRLELALFYLMMSVGIPSVFYGDEFYIEGLSEPQYRRAMPWGQKENCILQLKTWIALRKKHSALRNGNYRAVYCDDNAGLYVFLRQNAEETVLVILNNSDVDATYALENGDVVSVPAMLGVVKKVNI